MFKIQKITWILLAFTFCGTGIFAQIDEDVPDKELKLYAKAVEEVQNIDQQAQQKMVRSVQEQGLEIQRYNEIYQAQNDPNQEVDATPQELSQFESATREIEKIQMESQEEMQEKIVEEGLSVQRYREIAITVQNSPELQEKVNKYLQE